MLTREVSWGDGLVVEAFKCPGGLKAAVDVIARAVGVGVGTRNTFAKLFKVDTPELLDERDSWRAWLLLTTFGQDPSDWGISDDVVPSAFDPTRLRRRLVADIHFHGNESSHNPAA